MDVHCEYCAQPIEPTDWENNNVKQLSIGLVHTECPNKILISNCPQKISKDLLHKLFSPYGIILDISINDKYGLIEYDNKQSIQSAINSMNGFEMGANKLSVKMLTNILKNKQQPKSESDASPQYKFAKETLTTFNAKEIASLLVPNSKIHKNIYKQWMQLIIQHKHDVIQFIYYSKPNDANNETIFNYIPIPDYLKSMIIFKKDIDAAYYVKNQPRVPDLPSQHVIIVYGYIRKLERKLKDYQLFIIPSIIIELCFDYYMPITKIFCLEKNNKLIELELNTGQPPKRSMIIPPENRAKIHDIISCICIPDLIGTDIPFLQYYLDPNMSYYGIFGRDQTSHQFILYEKINDVDDYYMTFTAPNELHLETYADYLYCNEYGIIASDLDGLYQLKLKDINAMNDYKFTQLCYKWQWDHYAYLKMCYMRGLDKILAIQCSERIRMYDSKAKCAIFDFNTNEWKFIDFLDYLNNKLSSVYEHELLYCDMVYNYHDRSSVYLLSGSCILSQYDIN
eukprot:350457_1